MPTATVCRAANTDPFFTPEHLERRRQAMARYSHWQGVDDADPNGPCGHAYGIEKSTWLTRQSKASHWKGAMIVSPQDVVDLLKAAGIRKWVLMGLHGYVGYLPDPRATQDVNVMIGTKQRRRSVKAIQAKWPNLILREHSEVARFLDPQNLSADGQPKPVVDLMMPWGKFQQTILDEFVVTDRQTGHRIPTLEGALVSKYAAMVSLYRDRRKKEYDAADFRGMVRSNFDRIARNDLQRLGGEVWSDGAAEILRFVDIAMRDEPFPV